MSVQLLQLLLLLLLQHYKLLTRVTYRAFVLSAKIRPLIDLNSRVYTVHKHRTDFKQLLSEL